MKILHCHWGRYWWRNDSVNRSGIDEKYRLVRAGLIKNHHINWNGIDEKPPRKLSGIDEKILCKMKREWWKISCKLKLDWWKISVGGSGVDEGITATLMQLHSPSGWSTV